MPSSEAERDNIDKEFMEKWNFPNCLVALEGKQVIQAPFITGSYFYNKNSHSVVLMALVNANYNFTSVDVGSNGRVSDSGIFRECSLQRSIEAKFLRVPSPKSFSGRFTRVHYYVIIGDEAFHPKEYFMRRRAKNF